MLRRLDQRHKSTRTLSECGTSPKSCPQKHSRGAEPWTIRDEPACEMTEQVVRCPYCLLGDQFGVQGSGQSGSSANSAAMCCFPATRTSSVPAADVSS